MSTPVSIDKLRYGGDDVPDDPVARELRRLLRDRTEAEVRFDRGNRALYSTDASNYRQVPVGVVVPRTIDDVETTVAVCRELDVAVLGRGGGTSLAGQCCNAAVVLDFSKYLDRVGWLDPERRLASVEPGCILDDLRDRAEDHDLTFGPSPSTHDRCTVGGMVGNNACGTYAQMAGRTSDNIRELEILTYDGLRTSVGPTPPDELEAIIAAGGRKGEIYGRLRDLRDRYEDAIRKGFPDIPRRVSGFNLDELLPENGFDVARALVGTEGTCVLVLGVVTELIHSPQERVLVVLGFEDAVVAGRAVPDVLTHEPIALEGIDRKLISNMRRKGLHTDDIPLLPEGDGWLIVQLGGDDIDDVEDRAQALIDDLTGDGDVTAKLFEDPAEEADLWEIRESGLGATARVPLEPDGWPGWEDSAVPPDRVGDYLEDLHDLFDRYGYSASLYGHFGQGCIHTRIDFDLVTADGVANWKRFLDDAAELVVSYSGSLSGEHGDGQARGALLETMYGPELVDAMREFKAIWDPADRMNPGKAVTADPVDAHLRLGTSYRPQQLETHFAFVDDDGSMARATQRCVGVGKCRREGGGVMCPSFMVTREEAHSTRGRARLLFEMMDGELEADGWRSDEIADALDLCLACKGCLSDCPVDVDMATYKAEFMAHHNAGRLRPRPAYAMGLIWVWARLASRAPRLVNAVLRAPVVSTLLKRAAGLTTERPAPPFAHETFRSWFARHRPPADAADRECIVLWPDTFTNHLQPAAGRATVEVLEALGYRVELPAGTVCCGRPLYDYGMLPTAKRLLRRDLDVLRPHLEAGTRIVGVEPSCIATFRDELPKLFPRDLDANRLASQTVTLSELLRSRDHDISVLDDVAAVVQHHCHHHSVMGFHDEEWLLDQLGIDHDILDSGCCGLAGSFGFEAGEKYEISRAAGERVLLPRVREAGRDTLVVADGFSCRTQIAHGTERRGVHVAELVAAALSDDPAAAVDELREACRA